jgi:hypothetical protein
MDLPVEWMCKQPSKDAMAQEWVSIDLLASRRVNPMISLLK